MSTSLLEFKRRQESWAPGPRLFASSEVAALLVAIHEQNKGATELPLKLSSHCLNNSRQLQSRYPNPGG
eukprot:3758730-Rhodomonas_salina.3